MIEKRRNLEYFQEANIPQVHTPQGVYTGGVSDPR